MTKQRRLDKLQSDFEKHEQCTEELEVAINDERHEQRLKDFKKIDIDHPSNDFF